MGIGKNNSNGQNQNQCLLAVLQNNLKEKPRKVSAQTSS